MQTTTASRPRTVAKAKSQMGKTASKQSARKSNKLNNTKTTKNAK